jgi:hypothetical protein
MIKLFNQCIEDLSLTKAKSLIRAPFLSRRSKWIGSLVAVFALLGAALVMLHPAMAENNRHSDRCTLHLIPAFNAPVTTQGAAVPVPVGGQLTFGGSLAHPDHPELQIGSVGIQFVSTMSGSEGDELLGNGCMILPEGKISFQLLLRRPIAPDVNGDINRYSAITGGTGAYRNAGGELNHRTRANGQQEYILTFND